MITFVRRNIKPLLFRSPAKTPVEAQKTNIAKWRRKSGEASFLQDLIALRKVLCLCNLCSNIKLPRKWESRFGYSRLTAFHAVANCDWCREERPVSMFLPTEGDVWQQHELGMRSAAAVRKREMAAYDKDKRYLVGV